MVERQPEAALESMLTEVSAVARQVSELSAQLMSGDLAARVSRLEDTMEKYARHLDDRAPVVEQRDDAMIRRFRLTAELVVSLAVAFLLVEVFLTRG